MDLKQLEVQKANIDKNVDRGVQGQIRDRAFAERLELSPVFSNQLKVIGNTERSASGMHVWHRFAEMHNNF